MKDRLRELLLKSDPMLYCTLAKYEDARENGLLIELPCAIGTHLYRVTFPYRKEPKVTEYIVKNFRTVGKKRRLQLEVQAIDVPIKNWMEYSSFFTSKEEAEKALRKMNGGKVGEVIT